MTVKKSEEAQGQKNKTTVVVADDEPIIVMNMKEQLEDNGYDVVGTADDGFGAISLCRRFHPDVVLLDIKMPLLDGIAAAGYIKNNDLADTVIILSAFSDDKALADAGKNGVSGFLVKPVEINSLLSTIRISMANSRRGREMEAEMEKVRREMESRKKIEQAKGLVMKTLRLDEQSAFDLIRDISRQRTLSMDTVADIIISGYK